MKILRSCLALCVLALLVTTARSATDTVYQLKIESQPLADALQAFASQSGVQVMFFSEVSGGIKSKELVGQFTREEALKALLEGTGLDYNLVNERTVTIRERGSAGAVSADGSDAGGVRVAQGEAGSAEGMEEKRDASGSEEMAKLEEIVVTAQKRAERLSDVPISISVLTGADLDQSTAQGVNDALNRVPGVLTSVHYQGGTQVSVRGVAANGVLFRGASPISYYLDMVPFGFINSAAGPDADVYDLDRIEVLRGPQGTLYGASTLGGVLRVLTEDPDLDQFALKARSSFSSTENGGENYRGDLAVNVPLVEGRLAARAVVGYQGLGGWIDQPNNKDANESRIRNARLKIGAQPTEQLSIGATMWLSRSDRDAPPTSRDGKINGSISDLSGFTDYDLFGLKVGYDFEGFNVSSMTSYLDYEHTNRADELLDGNLLFDHPTARVFTEELLVNSTAEGNWRWSLGGYYRENKETYYVEQLPYVGYDGDISRSQAVFGEVTRLFLDRRLELTAGLRHFKDDLTTYEILRHFGATTPELSRRGRSFDQNSPRLVLTYHPRPGSTLYASYADGFRSGRLQSAFIAATAPDFPPVGPDTLKNYEVGSKGSMFDGRVGYEAAVYFTDWEDIQLTRSVQLLLPVSPAYFAVPLNGDSASGLGVDFSMTTNPVEGLDLGVNFSWNDLASDVDVTSRGIVLFAKGDRMNYSPRATVGGFVDYAFPLARGLKGRFSASANYTARQDFRNIQGGTRVNLHGDSMVIARTSFAVDSPEHWTTTLFIDNVNNEDGALIGPVFGVLDAPPRVRPRTYGIQVEYKF